MPRVSQWPKEESFNFRVDPQLKADFQSATEAEDKPAAQVLRDFMRVYIERRRKLAFTAEARRQSGVHPPRAPPTRTADEAEIMRWIGDVSSSSGWDP